MKAKRIDKRPKAGLQVAREAAGGGESAWGLVGALYCSLAQSRLTYQD